MLTTYDPYEFEFEDAMTEFEARHTYHCGQWVRGEFYVSEDENAGRTFWKEGGKWYEVFPRALDLLPKPPKAVMYAEDGFVSVEDVNLVAAFAPADPHPEEV